MIAAGSGPPLVLVPGIQGRYEWMRPAIEALAGSFHVVSYSLAGEPAGRSPRAARVAQPGHFDEYVHQLESVLDRHRLESAVVCGVSYGGWIAVRFAALHPHRTRGLILASTPGPRWTPDEHAARYLQAPLVFAPAFAMRSFRRLYREVVVALPERVARRRFVVTHLGRVVRAPTSPVRMAHRIHLARQVDFASSARAVTAPTLLVTGEADLDRVVPVSQTLEYRPLIPHARHVVIERAGHVGAVTRADAFARELRRFAAMDASVDAEPAALETEAG